MFMGVQRWGLRYGLLMIVQLNVLAQERVSFVQAAPFSNPTYSCRCLPMADAPIYRGLPSADIFAFHKDLCELRTYVRGMQEHMHLLASFFNAETRDVAMWFEEAYNRLNGLAGRDKKKDDGLLAWLEQRKVEIGNKGVLLKSDVYRELSLLPIEKIAAKLKTDTVRQALLGLKAQQSYALLLQSWQVLDDFAHCDSASLKTIEQFNQFFASDLRGDTSLQNQSICAYKATKDLADLTYVFYAFVKEVCAQSDINIDGEAKALITDFMVVYDHVSSLRIEETLKMISNFIKRFSTMISNLEQDANLHFEGWLKKKWALIPLAVGVVLVKIVYYFASPSASGACATVGSDHCSYPSMIGNAGELQTN